MRKTWLCVKNLQAGFANQFFLHYLNMGGRFQNYSWIKDFEADFPQKVGLKMLN